MNKAFKRKGKMPFKQAYLGRLTSIRVGNFQFMGRVLSINNSDSKNDKSATLNEATRINLSWLAS